MMPAPELSPKRNKLFGAVALGVTLTFLGLMLYAMTRDPNVLPSLLVGKHAPLAEAKWDDGQHFRSDAIVGRGRWTLINFWNTSCVVCRYEAPELERFYQEVVLRDETAPIFISINIQDEPELVERYKASYGLSFPIVLDRRGRISLDYGVYGTPETFFIDPAGTVRHRVAGDVDGVSIIRFIKVLEDNPNMSSEEAIEAFAAVRSGQI